MFALTIQTDNAAFADDPLAEVAAILRRVASQVEGCAGWAAFHPRIIRDTNGNRVGSWTYEAEAGE